MKKTLVVALGALLTMLFGGCATYTAAEIMISPPSLKGEKWTIGGTESAGNLTVRINGNPVIQGPLAYGGPTSLHANYEGHAIQTVCPLVGKYTQPYCQVYVDGTQAATLFFGMGSGPAPSSQGQQPD
ncbi:MAG: hypothetical protein KGL98_01570 [Gammaproteobacteria bacterium]|nr:hypothetical protein [Gammaproteobacteria bacterium]MBU6510295.1 hypothetical protein [Gammaproteobacteria bacterium]MDE1984285.1 hypothetical protein [Gammaproteobacteria bacterium]MDE2108230.1 hypothetical protein [Gammaproteobacteria bacterium]MDE2459912.1 hypothetical protein [Gammaproteobacteria bacterium]